MQHPLRSDTFSTEFQPKNVPKTSLLSSNGYTTVTLEIRAMLIEHEIMAVLHSLQNILCPSANEHLHSQLKFFRPPSWDIQYTAGCHFMGIVSSTPIAAGRTYLSSPHTSFHDSPHTPTDNSSLLPRFALNSLSIRKPRVHSVGLDAGTFSVHRHIPVGLSIR